MIGWDIGMSMWKAGFDAVAAGMRFSEMMLASGDVIGIRLGLMGDALRDPLRADHAELGLMVSEKAVAATGAAAVLAREWHKAQDDWLAQWRDAARLMSGAPSTLRAGEASARRAVRAAIRPMEAGMLAMAPFHEAATANARRLGRGRKRR